jgi:hypothetical protein
MNDRIPRSQRDHVLVDVKAQPSGWPTASLDPDSGRGPKARSGMPAYNRIHNSQVSTVSGDCRYQSQQMAVQLGVAHGPILPPTDESRPHRTHGKLRSAERRDQ